MSPAAAKPATPSITLFGWPIVAEPFEAWWSRLVAQLSNRSLPLTIFTPNPEIVVAGQHDPSFHATVAQADYLIPDGMGLVWASRWQAWVTRLSGASVGQTIPERIAGVDVVARLIDWAAQTNQRVLVIGGRDYVIGTQPVDQPAQHVAQLPGQVWWLPGYQQITQPTPAEEQHVLAEINRLKPAIVLVAFGAPHQERWAIAHRVQLRSAGVGLVMTVGGAIDFLLGKVPRAPQVLQRLGLEWLYRLVRQPWRIWRQLSLIEFGWRALRQV